MFHHHNHDFDNGDVRPSTGILTHDRRTGITVEQCPKCGNWGLVFRERVNGGSDIRFWGQGHPNAPETFNGLPAAWLLAYDIGHKMEGWEYDALEFVPQGQGLPIFPVYGGTSYRQFLGKRDATYNHGIATYPVDFERYRFEYAWIRQFGARPLYAALREQHLRMLAQGFDRKPRPFPWKLDLRSSAIRRFTIPRYVHHRHTRQSRPCVRCGADSYALYGDLSVPRADAIALCDACAKVRIAVSKIPWLRKEVMSQAKR